VALLCAARYELGTDEYSLGAGAADFGGVGKAMMSYE